MTLFKKTLLGIGIVVFLACGTVSGKGFRDPSLPDSGVVELCIVNQSLDAYRIYLNNHKYGSVYPGEKKLLRVRNPETVRSIFGYGLAKSNPITPYPEVHLDMHPRWEWVITVNPHTNGLSLINTTRTQCD